MEGKDESLEVFSKLKSLVDLKHVCGFVTLLDLPLSAIQEKKGKAEGDRRVSPGPTNGKVSKEQADLLAEELDSIADPAPEQKDRERKIKEMTLDVGAGGGGKEKKTRVPEWKLLDINFGVPLFDADLNKDVCKRIVTCGLWKKERYTGGNGTRHRSIVCTNAFSFFQPELPEAV